MELFNNNYLRPTVNVSPYIHGAQYVILSSLHLSQYVHFIFFMSVCSLLCPFIDPVFSSSTAIHCCSSCTYVCFVLSLMSNTTSWIAITSCLSSGHQFPFSSESVRDRMDASGFLSLLVITRGKRGLRREVEWMRGCVFSHPSQPHKITLYWLLRPKQIQSDMICVICCYM